MWVCPKCGREFKRTNQGHYCGKAPENVNEYIEVQTLEAHARLTEDAMLRFRMCEEKWSVSSLTNYKMVRSMAWLYHNIKDANNELMIAFE